MSHIPQNVVPLFEAGIYLPMLLTIVNQDLESVQHGELMKFLNYDDIQIFDFAIKASFYLNDIYLTMKLISQSFIWIRISWHFFS